MKNKFKFALVFMLLAFSAMTAAVVYDSEDSDAASPTVYVADCFQTGKLTVTINYGDVVTLVATKDSPLRESFTLVGGPPSWMQTLSTENSLQTGRWKIDNSASVNSPPIGETKVQFQRDTYIYPSGTHIKTDLFYITFVVEKKITFDYGVGSGSPTSMTSTGQTINLPAAYVNNGTFDGWFTSASGGTWIGAGGTTWVPTASMTLYAHYSYNAVQFKIGGLSTTATSYTLPYNGYMQLNFQVDPIAAAVTIQTNPTGSGLSVTNSGGNVTLAGSISNVLPGTYYLQIKASFAGYTDGVMTVQLNVATAIIEPITAQVYVGQIWWYQITTIPASANIQSYTVTNAQGTPISPGTSFAMDPQSGTPTKSISFQPLQEGLFYITLNVWANGYSPATKQIIIQAINPTTITNPPTATGITATPNDQVDGGWYFIVEQPQNYHKLLWDFGDGSAPASEISVTHQYSRNGTFQVTCTLYNLTSGQTYIVTTEVSVRLEQQIGLDAWVGVPYSYAIQAPGTDTVTMTTDINQGWLSIRTFEHDSIRYAELYSDTGPFAGLADSDLTVTISIGGAPLTTFTIHIWPPVDEVTMGNFGFSLSASGMTVTMIQTGSNAASYVAVNWGDGLNNRSSTHTYASAGTYTVTANYMGNGGALATRFGMVTVPSNSIEYNVYYNANGGTGHIPPSFGQSIAVAQNTFTFTGHTFLYWNTAQNGKGTTFAPGALINGLNADLTLFAIWSGGGGGGGSWWDNIVDKLNEKFLGIPLWGWILMIILIVILALWFLREVFE